MARGMTTRDMRLGTPQWAAEPISGRLINGGVKLDPSTFPVDAETGVKTVKGGTMVSRTFAQAATGAPYRLANGTDDMVHIVAFDIWDVADIPDATLVRPNTVIFENYLPQVRAGTQVAGALAKVRATYICKRGVK